MKKVLYFAYGSNLHIGRLIIRVGDVSVYSTYKLYGYKLTFDATNFGCSYANITKTSYNDYVEGVLYELTPAQFSELDRYEALYDKYFFDVTKNTLGCVYIARPSCTADGVPCKREYLETIIEGAQKFGLKQTELITTQVLNETPTYFSKKKKGKTTYGFNGRSVFSW